MSEIINDFIHAIEQKPELFLAEDQHDLKQRTWSNDVDQLEEEILDWYETRESIASAAMKNLSSKEQEKKAFLEEDTQTLEIKPEDYKEMLLNAIHRNFSTPMATVANNNY